MDRSNLPLQILWTCVAHPPQRSPSAGRWPGQRLEAGRRRGAAQKEGNDKNDNDKNNKTDTFLFGARWLSRKLHVYILRCICLKLDVWIFLGLNFFLQNLYNLIKLRWLDLIVTITKFCKLYCMNGNPYICVFCNLQPNHSFMQLSLHKSQEKANVRFIDWYYESTPGDLSPFSDIKQVLP